MNAVQSAAGHLDIGGVFDRTSEIYKATFSTVWLVALVIMLPTAIIVAILGDGALQIIGSLVTMAASAWLVGSIVRVVEDVEADGRVDKGVGEVLGSVWPLLISLILLQIVVGILVFVGMIFLIVPGVILALMWIVSVPSMVVESRGVFEAMSRSSELTSGNRMRILAIGIVVFLIYIGVMIVAAIFTAISPVLGVIAMVAAAVLLYPFVAIITSVLYFRLRELEQSQVVTSNPVPPPPAI